MTNYNFPEFKAWLEADQTRKGNLPWDQHLATWNEPQQFTEFVQGARGFLELQSLNYQNYPLYFEAFREYLRESNPRLLFVNCERCRRVTEHKLTNLNTAICTVSAHELTVTPLRLNHLNDELANRIQALNQERGKVQGLQTELANAKRELEQKDEDSARFEATQQALGQEKTKSQNLQRQLNLLTQEKQASVDNLKEQIQAQETELQSQVQAKQALSREKEELKELNQKLQGDNRELLSDIHNYKQTIAHHEQNTQALQKQIKALTLLAQDRKTQLSQEKQALLQLAQKKITNQKQAKELLNQIQTNWAKDQEQYQSYLTQQIALIKEVLHA